MATIRRSDWRAGPHRAPRIAQPVRRLFLHHTVTPEWTGVEAAQRLQAIARSRRFVDVSYSWLVDVRGNAIEGRGWGRQGAHTVGHNSTAHAIALVGNFQSRTPPPAMVATLAALVRAHRNRGPGQITGGHRDVAQTACPGSRAYALIPQVNRMAAGVTTPAPALEEDHMSYEQGKSYGKDLEVVQRSLSRLTGMPVTADGAFGPQTRAANVKAQEIVGHAAMPDKITPTQIARMELMLQGVVPGLREGHDKQHRRIKTLEDAHVETTRRLEALEGAAAPPAADDC